MYRRERYRFRFWRGVIGDDVLARSQSERSLFPRVRRASRVTTLPARASRRASSSRASWATTSKRPAVAAKASASARAASTVSVEAVSELADRRNLASLVVVLRRLRRGIFATIGDVWHVRLNGFDSRQLHKVFSRDQAFPDLVSTMSPKIGAAPSFGRPSSRRMAVSRAAGDRCMYRSVVARSS
jgi:hypothetical protein